MEQEQPDQNNHQEPNQSRWGFRGMTLRDWLELLIVPLALLGLGLMFDLRQQGIEDQRAASERELEEQRAQDAVLQACLDQMSELILNRNLLETEEGDAVYTLAQARTSTAIAGLDAEHNMSVARFLADSGLNGSGESSISLLKDAWFRDANLRGADLQQADLSGADLSGADLRNAALIGTKLNGAFLDGADLSDAFLIFADMSDARLVGADLSNVKLDSANLTGAILEGADLSGAHLFNADLSNAAFFSGANPSGADLTDANLSGAQGVTEGQLEQQAASLEGATMPNGQKYEE